MEGKIIRQGKVSLIIRGQTVSTQEELLGLLRQKGIRITQATLSRDLKELGVVQVPGSSGRYYQLPAAGLAPVSPGELAKRLGSYVTEIKQSGNLIVVKTPPGEASGTARLIDGLNLREVLGTIAGDDTFLIVAKNKKSMPKIMSVMKTT